MLRSSITILAVALASLGVAACQSTEQKVAATSIDLPPMDMPSHPVGTNWVISNGKVKGPLTIAAKDGNGETIQSPTGCSYTRSAKNMFAPSSVWKGCEWGSGEAKVAAVAGSMFPLRVGARQTWTWSGSSDRGYAFDGARECEAVAAERVTLAAGSFDAYKVVCTDTWRDGSRTITWYVAPSVGMSVLTVFGSTWGSGARWEYVSGPHQAKSS
jgi:hypothetical protein